MQRGTRKIERHLARTRPEPPLQLVESIAGRVEGKRKTYSARSRRFGPALALTVTVAVALAASGGVGFAQSTVSDSALGLTNSVKDFVTGSPTTTPSGTATLKTAPSSFVAAQTTYPVPSLTCSIKKGPGGGKKLGSSGGTGVASGTISITYSRVTGTQSGFPFTRSVSVTALTWDDPADGPNTSSGVTYTASATQTASGYDPTTVSCGTIVGG